MMASCASKNDKEATAAESLLQETRAAIDRGDYTGAIELLDTLQTRYPTVTDAQRKAMNLRPVAIEGLTIQEIEDTDSLFAVTGWQADSLSRLFRTVSHKDLVEPYHVSKDAPQSLIGINTLQARLSPAGEFYLISSLDGHPVKHTSVTVEVGGESASTESIPFDNARNYRSGNYETITFSSAKCDSIARFITRHDNKAMKLAYNGDKTYRTNISAKEVHRIADAWRWSAAQRRHKAAGKKLELLRAKLQLARDQQAITSAASEQAAD
ncbi:MAG: tetratricopeptide repeat protein [Muribaculaceae bacterium]|nr:tetratricopeptide repeat protein [Muribaculaceae bacterium]